MDSHAITVSSLGRIASIGDLYDARRDSFCGPSVFCKDIPTSAITIIDDPDMKTEFIYSDRVSDKFKKLDVNAELQVSILSGLVKLAGSGRYLNDQKSSARSVKISLIYNIKTKFEKLNILHQDLEDALATNISGKDYATHIVTGISWGANSIISCSFENEENRDVTEVAGEMSAVMNKLSWSIDGKGKLDYTGGETGSDKNFKIKVCGDVFPKGKKLPTTIEAAMEFVKQIPELVAESNSGKGKPLAYTLTPIKFLQNQFQMNISFAASLRTLEENSLLRVVHFVEHLTTVKQQLNDFYDDANSFKYSIHYKELINIADLKTNFAIYEASFRTKLSSTLTDLRSGKENTSTLEQLLENFQKQDSSPDKVLLELEGLSKIKKKFNFARVLVNSGAKYIGLGNSLDEERLLGKSMVFYFYPDARSSDPGKWNANREIFFQEMHKKDSNCNFYAVDCEFHPSLVMQERTSCVQILQHGRVVVEDELQAQEKFKNTPWAKINGTPKKTLYKPLKRAPFQVPCTGQTCNSTEVYYWKCTKCLEAFEYGFDSHVYCACGKTLPMSLLFKCTDSNHGNTYDSHEETFLLEYIKTLRAFKELNILILGETGVGKSTWINSFLNYLSYETLEEALKAELLTVIPSKFTVCNDNYEVAEVVTGRDQNESFDNGMSGTQGTKVYQFEIANAKVRIIDSPGIGDVRGVDQDCSNFQNILGTISNLEELHGVCILLKPNSSKLTVMFRFCVEELLTNLHKDACKNIVFCFTNSRGTSYKPGETYPALRTLLEQLAERSDVQVTLSKDTLYCFDSEPYRFLATSKHYPRFQFDKEDIENFTKSWSKSVSETARLLEHISGLEPHQVKNTLSLNYARQSILNLTKPLAEISHNIDLNKAVVEDEIKAAKDDNLSKKGLENQRWITRMELKFVKLDYPKTVCSNSACCVSRTLNDGINSEYTRYCHNPCELTGVPADTIGNAGLLRCWAMTNGVCRICDHSYEQHLHTYYEAKQEEIKVEDQNIVELLNRKLTKEKTREKLISLKKKQINDYVNEQQAIQNASINFAYFLKQNAITPYNDGMEQYLNHQIRKEQAKVGVGGCRKTLENLEESKKSYIEQRNILEKAMKECHADVPSPGPADMEKLIKQLQELPFSGPKIRDALNCIEHTSNVVYRETVINDRSKLGKVAKAKKFFGKRYSKYS